MKNMRFIVLLLALALLTGCAAKAPEPAAESATEAEPATVVSTVDELIAAVAPGAVVELAEGVFTLTDASTYGRETGSKYCSWAETYEGYELEIHDVDGLTLRGQAQGTAKISAAPRYANVLSFRNCKDLRIEDLVAGHTEAPGWCSGGVLRLAGCEDVGILRCGLYGCGTIGVWADNCRELHVEDSDIYECSYNAAALNECKNTQILNCRFYRCGVKGGEAALSLVEAWHCSDVLINGIEIYDNDASSLLRTDNSRGVVLLSCDVHDNIWEYSVFSLTSSFVTVDGCALGDNRFLNWTSDQQPADANGHALTDEALESMTFREIDPSAVISTAPEAGVEVAPGGEIRVADVDELLAAIGPDRTIVLAPGVYDLENASDYGGFGGEYYYWQQSYDGPALIIEDADGLTLRAESTDPAETVITAVPRYANVLSFQRCEDLTVEGLTLGHTKEPGECAGGVLDLADCSRTLVRSCRLYGCGTCGVSAWNGSALSVEQCEIYECSMNAASIISYEGVTFTGCDVHDIPSPALYFDSSYNMHWNGEEIFSGMYDVTPDGGLQTFSWPENDYTSWVPFQADSAELAFALEMQRVFAQSDWEALKKLVSYPIRIYTADGNYVFQDAESLTPERLAELLPGEFRRQVACSSLYDYRVTSVGSVFADGALAFEYVTSADGDALRLTAISTRYDLN